MELDVKKVFFHSSKFKRRLTGNLPSKLDTSHLSGLLRKQDLIFTLFPRTWCLFSSIHVIAHFIFSADSFVVDSLIFFLLQITVVAKQKDGGTHLEFKILPIDIWDTRQA